MARAKRKTADARPTREGEAPERWSTAVTRSSFALDLEPGVFTWEDPERIALSLKRSAEESRRRKAGPFQSAMSMLNFYINRAGRSLDPGQRRVLEEAKDALRRAYGRPAHSRPSAAARAREDRRPSHDGS
jgi:Protein of unknown function (DUF3175)